MGEISDEREVGGAFCIYLLISRRRYATEGAKRVGYHGV